MQRTLSPQALQIIHEYLSLPIGNVSAPCPYYNNRRQKIRGALRALVGKGSVEDIIEEVTILSLKEKISLKTFDVSTASRFLIDHHIGIDCAGLVYYILNAELLARKKKSLHASLLHPTVRGVIRQFLIRLRTVENTNVATFANEKNSVKVHLDDITPSDIITMEKTGIHHDRDHILLIHEVTYENALPHIIHYTHAFQWTTDGPYGHGVCQGTIEIVDRQTSLLEQRWLEKEKKGAENETLMHAKQADRLEVRRLCVLER